MPVVLVIRPEARALIVSQGKGLDKEAARLSGLMEAAESFHAERIDKPVVLAQLADLPPGSTADPALLAHAHHSLFSPHLRIPWIEGHDIARDVPVLVPLELVHTDFTLPLMPGTGCFARSSNGLAAGDTREEALLHGLCEVVERDAYALLLAGAARRDIDLGGVADPALAGLLRQIGDAGCVVAIADITSDLGVPVFMATVSGGRSASPVTPRPAGGFGCHPDPAVACLKAVMEAVQARLTRIAGARDDLDEDDFVPVTAPPVAGTERHPFPPPSPFAGTGVAEYLAWVTARLQAAGFGSIIAVDLTRPEIGLPVVRMIVPGLEGLPGACVPGARAAHVRRSHHRVSRPEPAA